MTAFNPTTTLVASLPASTTDLNKQIHTIMATDTAIKNQDGRVTPEQQQVLDAAFADALNIIRISLDACNGALQTMSQFVVGEQPYEGYLQGLSSSTQANIDTCITSNMNNLLGGAPCGSGDVTNAFNGLKNTIAASINTLARPFTNVNARFVTARQAASTVAGTLLALQNEYPTVSQQIEEAQTLDPTSPVRMVKFYIALTNWRDLTNYANAKLSH